jgi:two-component system response regulator ChvI
MQSEQLRRRAVVVDDDEMFRESLLQNLSDAGFAAMVFGEGPAAIAHLIQAGAPDIILLDWKMPGMTGIEVLRELRRLNIEAPVVFLTVLSDQVYEEAGLLGGAVDFIEKSRSVSILLRRIELILYGRKRDIASTDAQQSPATMQHGSIQLRRDVHRASWKGVELDLTVTEFQILECLVMRAGQDVRYRELYDIVRGEGFAAGSGEAGFRVNVRSLIKRIRQKFRQVDDQFSHIENYPGFGYRWRNSNGE